MAGKTTFLGLYKKLNSEQKKAVDTIEGPVMVIAGPGTGKTQILTLRIANILRKTDTAPECILALTFTESGVFSMRKRLTEIIGSAAYRVRIHTFHGFCNDVIRRFPDSFQRLIGSEHISDIDKITLLKELIVGSELKWLKPFGDNFYYLNDIRKTISEIKRENISPDNLRTLVKQERDAFHTIDDLYYTEGKYKGLMRGVYRGMEKKIEKNTDLCLLYERYQEALSARKYYDYEDMIMETISVLSEDTDLLLSLQEEFQYILADEHQDANNSQNRLLELLANFHENPNLFIVGDEKQAIFRFQGASLENFKYFKRRYPDASIITLVVNYRSRQHILDSAHSLLPSDTALHSHKKDTPSNRIALRVFSKTAYEYAFLAEDIKVKCDEGVLPEEIAVLYRNNSDADALVRTFEKTTIPFEVLSAENVLADTDIRKFLLILRAVSEFGNDGAFCEALHIDFLAVDPLDLYKALRYAQKKRVPPFSVLSSETKLKKAGITNTKTLYGWYRAFRTWKKASDNMPLLDLFEVVANESGFITYILNKKEADIILQKVRGLFDDLAALTLRHREYRLADYLAYAALLDEHGISITKDSHSMPQKRVRLMTAHKSKGMEFEYVYIIGARDTHWGNKRQVTHFSVPFESGAAGNNDDERRLFYVALTRAREGVSISYTRENERGALQSPSLFVEEIDKTLIETVSTDEFEKSVSIEKLLQPKKETGVHTIADKTFLNELFKEQGFSVTALNNYLACPWNYFYNNLLRLPKSPNKHMLFGTAMHNALKRYYDTMTDDTKACATDTLKTLFEEALLRQPFSEREYEEMRKKGAHALTGYTLQSIKEGESVRSEFKIETHLPLSLLDSPTLLLRGVLDRMDITPDGHSVVVTDYKTGKPKSRNAIEGKTKSDSGDYKRQLVFYALLLQLFDNGRYTMTEGVIDFIEPDPRGRYRQERFSITQEEVTELTLIIQNTAAEITDLSFWNHRCDDTKCHWCALRDLMR